MKSSYPATRNMIGKLYDTKQAHNLYKVEPAYAAVAPFHDRHEASASSYAHGYGQKGVYAHGYGPSFNKGREVAYNHGDLIYPDRLCTEMLLMENMTAILGTLDLDTRMLISTNMPTMDMFPTLGMLFMDPATLATDMEGMLLDTRDMDMLRNFQLLEGLNMLVKASLQDFCTRMQGLLDMVLPMCPILPLSSRTTRTTDMLRIMATLSTTTTATLRKATLHSSFVTKLFMKLNFNLFMK